MKVIILAGGQQSTIEENRVGVPKPMAEIGGKPILWHIMKQFSYYGYNDFIICGGYHINMIKEYFTDYYIYQSDITVDLSTNQVEIHKKKTEDWKVTVVDTGIYATTLQRIESVQKYVDDAFIVTYGDCLSDISVDELVKAHTTAHKLVTMAVAKPIGRNVIMNIANDGSLLGSGIDKFDENEAWVNACMFIFNKKVLNYFDGNYEIDTLLLPKLAERNEIATYKHYGFWNAVETRRDKVELENLWNAKTAPWKIWS